MEGVAGVVGGVWAPASDTIRIAGEATSPNAAAYPKRARALRRQTRFDSERSPISSSRFAALLHVAKFQRVGIDLNQPGRWQQIHRARLAAGSAHLVGLELIQHAAKRRMSPVLDLDPAIRAPAAISALAMLRDQAFQAEETCVPEQIRADLALFEIAQKDAIDTARQQPGKVGLAIDSGSLRRSSPSLTRQSNA